MLTQLGDAVRQWPVIVQGALGSALFWMVLGILRLVIAKVQQGVRKQTTRVQIDILTREYIFKKYTCHSGLAYYPQGYFLTFSYVLKFFLIGMLFFSLALLGGGITPLFLSIGLIGAVYYFLKSLSWLIPDRGWNSQSTLQKWKRIAELEQTLFGKIDEDTVGEVSKWSQEEDKNKSNQASDATLKSTLGADSSVHQS